MSERLASWPDEETWLSLLEPMLSPNRVLANTAANLWYTLMEMIEGSAKERKQAIKILEEGFRLTYLFSSEHQLALALFRLERTGHLHPKDEPRRLLREAVERSEEVVRAERRRAAARERRGHSGKGRAKSKGTKR